MTKSELISIISEFAGDSKVAFYRTNWRMNGDELILKASIQLLNEAGVQFDDVKYTTTPIDAKKIIVMGGGGLQSGSQYLIFQRFLECHFGQGHAWLVLPSSIEDVDDFLLQFGQEDVTIMSRDTRTFDYLTDSGIQTIDAEDTALFYSDYPVATDVDDLKLFAFRTDYESINRTKTLLNTYKDFNSSISLDQYLSAISKASSVETDFLHVAIAATVMGKPTTLYAGKNGKQLGVWEKSLKDRGCLFSGPIDETKVEDYRELRKAAYIVEGADISSLIVALVEKEEGRPESLNKIQVIRANIKARYPKP